MQMLAYKALSRPSRARGLKLGATRDNVERNVVAPLAGAWVETGKLWNTRQIRAVAPLAGAWVETSTLIC